VWAPPMGWWQRREPAAFTPENFFSRAGGGRACHPIARACSMPFTFGDGLRGCTELPDGGWDAVIRWAHDDWLAGAI
jgi:hypothetical protein